MALHTLRFLADESCDYAVTRALRAAGFDVLAVGESTTRSVDRDIIEQAGRERRVLLTEDKDFGWLVFAAHVASPGVILVRYPGNARQGLASSVVAAIQEHAEQLAGAFVVVEPGRVRISRKLAPAG
jgi:predicted nuclease of predicted toxin-antitoxin system